MSTLKRYLVSSAYTLIASFLMVVVANWNQLNVDVFDSAMWFSVFMLAARTAIKTTGEFLLPLLVGFFSSLIKQ